MDPIHNIIRSATYYLPLYIFCGEHLLCARLRSSDRGAAHGVVEELQRIVTRLREAWPQVRITVRGDSGFCNDELMSWCEQEGVDYVLGLAKNERLKKRITNEDVYCARGDMENRIKEQQLGLFADRTSSALIQANQLRLYFSAFAYLMMQTLRRVGLVGTKLARAQSWTLRLKLLKIGAQVRVTTRKVWLSFSESYPYAALLRTVLAQVQTLPLRC